MPESTHIEQQLTILLRRVQSIHFATRSDGIELDRSGYGIMCRLADAGAQRLSSLAHTFGLDPSTITRQVQSLEHSHLVQRRTDPSDRRASLLDLSDGGRDLLEETRDMRRQRLREALSDWSHEEHTEFGRLLEKFNDSFDRFAHLVEHPTGTPSEL